ncbi:sunset domain-containing protein [Lentzea sp. CA-135723]|uniref:sunset domain-containing protein n=1 Tax=Lentzea sp. CA-135723 TaxID=3239950 RepID=UPI003D8A0E25
MFGFFFQMFLLCAGAFLAGVLLTWLTMRTRDTAVEAGPLSIMEEPTAPVPAIKANSRTMMFHTPDSPYYKRMKGDAFFHSPEDARRAGYTMWTPRPRVPADA